MRSVTLHKAQRSPGLYALAQSDDLEQLTHFMLHHQLGRHGARLEVGGVQLGRQPAVDEEIGLIGVAQHIKARILCSHRCAGEVDVGRNVLEPHQHQRIAVDLVLVMADHGAHVALLVVVLTLTKTIVNEEGCAARQPLTQRADKGFALRVNFGQIVLRATNIHRCA